MQHEFTIEADVLCVRCKYNLRTQSVVARCSECGYPVLRSYIRHEAVASGSLHLPDEPSPRAALRVLAQLLGRNRDSIALVLAAHRHAGLRHVPRNIFKTVEINAELLCESVRDYAIEYYGGRDEALATFRFWRLERSEDVGEIVAALVEAGLIVAGEKDAPDDFVGLFTLKTLFK